MSPRTFAQRGAATLVVVMILFFVMALVAAYANRNLVVEQRVAANYQEATLANEVAIKGSDTLLALINAPNVDQSCQIDAAGPGTLRDRLLSIDSAGAITRRAAGDLVICDQATGGSWNCQCPTHLRPTGLAQAANRSSSARISLANVPALGQIEVASLGCAQGSANCSEAFGANDATGFFAQTKRRVRLVLISALKMPPTSALIATGTATFGGMAAANDDASTGGIAAQVGLTATDADNIRGPGGSGKESALLLSSALNALSAEDLFRKHFGMLRSEYRTQPAVETLSCETACASALRTRIAAGAQLIWREGDLTLNEDVELGTLSRPIVLIVNGALTLQGPMRINGVVFAASGASWTAASATPAWLNGSLVVAGNWRSDTGVQLRQDSNVTRRLMTAAGSFVRAPGGTWSEQ